MSPRPSFLNFGDKDRVSPLRSIGKVVVVLLSAFAAVGAGAASDSAASRRGPIVTDVQTDKARYAPGEPVLVNLEIDNSHGPAIPSARVSVQLQDLGRSILSVQRAASISAGKHAHVQVTFTPPVADYRGYRVQIQLRDAQQKLVAAAATAVDVSSDWSRFPRYGYLAHFDANIPAQQWIAELNRFHINGLQFYDFQYKHHLPEPPAAADEWPDIAKRPTARKTLLAFLSEARIRNMTTMAYNASYAAYADAFRDGSGVKLEWATWPDTASPRNETSTKSLNLSEDWATRRLIYMNQDDPGWQRYIFSRMTELFEALPFDGWHIDTYGDAGAFAWDGTPINYYAGFGRFADAARAALDRPVLLNTVGAHGQANMANSAVDFVYSELWDDDHPTYASIQAAADEIHTANASKALVFPAYLHRNLSNRLRQDHGPQVQFNTPAVLLADAVMFSVGASHLELGDGDRMLSSEYFPADTAITPSPDLRNKLKSYYDFLVAYENYLRDGAGPSSFPIALTGASQSLNGGPGAVWTIGREKGSDSIVHLINLTAVKQANWRDDDMSCPPAPILHDLKLTVQLPADISEVGWASPDIDDGSWHVLPVKRSSSAQSSYEVTVPQLNYWTVVIFRRAARTD